MKKIRVTLVLIFLYSLSFSQFNSKTMDLRDAFVGTYKTISPHYIYHLLVQKITSSVDSLIIHDSLWSTGATTGCPVNCYQHRVKLNADSTWFQYSQYYGNFKKTDTIHLHFLAPGSPPTVYDYDGKRVNAVGINELLSNNGTPFFIYPNPASSKLFLRNAANIEVIKCILLNSQGKEVLNESINTEELNISDLQEGLYFLQIETSQGILTKKIVVQH